MKNSRIEYRLVSALEDCVEAMVAEDDGSQDYQTQYVMAINKAKSMLKDRERGEHPCKGSYLKIGGKS